MKKSIAMPISIAAVGFMAGGIMLGSLGVSAHEGENGRFGQKGDRAEVAAEVLGVEVEELQDLKGSGVTFEEYVTDNGFDSIDAYHEALADALEADWAEEGLSDEVIAERLARMQERQEFRGVMSDIHEDLLGLSREERIAAHDDGSTREELIQAAGYESVQEFQEAVDEALEEAGLERPGRGGSGGGQGGPRGGHRGF